MTDLVTVSDSPLAVPNWSGRSAASLKDTAAAIDRLPRAPDDDPSVRLAQAFLADYPTHSRRGYASDLWAGAAWCASMRAHPFDAGR